MSPEEFSDLVCGSLGVSLASSTLETKSDSNHSMEEKYLEFIHTIDTPLNQVSPPIPESRPDVIQGFDPSRRPPPPVSILKQKNPDLQVNPGSVRPVNPEIGTSNIFMSQADTIVKRVMSCVTLDDPNINNIIKTDSELDLAMFMSKALVASIMYYSKAKKQNELTPIPTTAQPSFESSATTRYPETVPLTFPKPIAGSDGSSHVRPLRSEDTLFSRTNFPSNAEPPKQDRIGTGNLAPEPLKISAYLEELRDSNRDSQNIEINPFPKQTDSRKSPEVVSADTARNPAPDLISRSRSEFEKDPFRRESSVEFIERVERSKSRERYPSPRRSRSDRDQLYERITSPSTFDRRQSPVRSRDRSYERRMSPPRVREERPSYGRRPSPPRISGEKPFSDRRTSPPRASDARPKYDDHPYERRSQNDFMKISPPRYSNRAKLDSDQPLRGYAAADDRRISEPNDYPKYDSRTTFDRPHNRVEEYERGRPLSPARERPRPQYESYPQPQNRNDRKSFSPPRAFVGDLRSKLAEKRRSDDVDFDKSVKNPKFENNSSNPFK